MFIQETMQTEITKSCDVLVCGGGFGGISAALAAARCGKKVILPEKLYMLGGLGTAGLVTIYLPLCDGYGHQVSFGIAEELLRLSIEHGWETRIEKHGSPDIWFEEHSVAERRESGKRYDVQFNPHLFIFITDTSLINIV